jgi:hypothetical protein
MAATPPATDFSTIDQQIADLQAHITQSTNSGALTPEGAEALQGKQQELIDREAKLKAESTVTPDEKSALLLSIHSQEAMLARLTRSAQPPVKTVDPASLPPPTYITPNGTAIIAPNGNYNNSGVVVSPNGTVTTPVAPGTIQPLPNGGTQR